MPRDIDPLEAGKRTHADIVKLREQKRVHEVAAIDRELRIINGLLGDLQPRRARPQETAASSPIEFCFQLFGARNQIWQSRTETNRALRSRPGSRSLIRLVSRLIAACSDSSTFFGSTTNQLLPARIIGKRDPHDDGRSSSGRGPGHAKAPQAASASIFKRQIFEQRPPSCGEIMLHRIGEGEKIATGFL